MKLLHIIVILLISQPFVTCSVFATEKEGIASLTDISTFAILQQVIHQLDKNYIRKIAKHEYEENAIKGVISSLDPHSTYFSPQSFQHMQDITNGEFAGIGVEITIDNGLPVVIAAYESGPAFKSGIESGDIILSANGQVLMNMPINDVGNILRGNVGQAVKLEVQRKNKKIKFNIKREIIKILPVKIKLIADASVVYIRINSFNAITAKLLQQQYARVITQKSNDIAIQGVVLDLRSNPGGLLEQAVAVTGMFLDHDMPVVSIKGRNDEFTRDFRTDNKDITNGLPIVVIINNGSASAAEIVAGALQDHRRAQVVGKRSFGKGSVQVTIPIQNGGGIKITTALYYTPNGRIIQENGIKPNIEVDDSMIVKKITSLNNISENDLKNKLPHSVLPQHDNTNKQNDIEFNKEIFFYNRNVIGNEATDFQLMRAVDLLNTLNFALRTLEK